MRILKIHFKNLNSLAGEWELDLTQPEFREEGCFLITGPTGSGKSTLLDAISLALYGRTPRLEGFSASKDEVMTRNTSECFADVCFQTSVGTFRAHWSHRRASRGQNPFAKSEQSLTPLDANTLEPLADAPAVTRKGEKDKEIEECTGLNYAQFTRAILLAQGEFAQFLKAKQEDKALILEKLTSTEIYRELSKYAHIKTRAAADDLAARERELGELKPLSPEEVETYRQQIAQDEERLEELKKLRLQCQENITWVDQIDSLRQEARALECRHVDLKKRQEKFSPLAKRLEEAIKATGLGGAWAELTMLRKQQVEGKGREKHLEENLTLANAALEDSQKRLNESREAHAKAREDARASKPLLDEARSLDQDILRQSSDAESLGRKLAEQRQLHDHLVEQLTQQEAREKQLHQELSRLLNWQNDHVAYQGTDLASLKIRLDQLVERQKLLSSAEERCKEAERNVAVQDAQLAELDRQLPTAEQQLLANEHTAQELLQRRQQLLGDNTLTGIRELREEKERSLRGAVVIKSLEEHRARLTEGKPCPLCGATSHPFAASGVLPQPEQLERELSDLKQRLAALEALDVQYHDCERAKQALEAKLQILRDRCQGLHTVRQQAGLQMESADKEMATQREALATLSAEVEASLLPLGVDARQKPERVLADLEKCLNKWRRSEEKRKNLETESQRLAQEKTAMVTSKQVIGKNLAQAEAETQAARMELANLRQKRREKFGGQTVEAVEKRLEEQIHAADAALEAQRKAEDRSRGTVDQLTGNLNQVRADLQRLEPLLQNSEMQFANMLAKLQWNEDFYLQCARDEAHIPQWRQQQRDIDNEEQRLKASIEENAAKLEQKLSQDMTTQNRSELVREQQELEKEGDRLNGQRGQISQLLKQDAELRARRAGMEQELEAKKREFERWKALNDLIGSSRGNVFSAFAQNLTLDTLLAHANIQFAQLLDRYRFSRAKGEDSTGLVVIDAYHADERRPLQNLSGGETFLASLALALGLSAMASRNTPIDSLFLDEGFGSLDGGTLYNAVETIKNLRGENKLIGIISHVEALKEHFPTQIEVRPISSGRSALRGPGCRRLG